MRTASRSDPGVGPALGRVVPMQSLDAEHDVPYGPPPQYRIESVDNALRLLLLFETQPSIRLTDASHFLGVASSTAHRLLGMLQYRGFVRQNPATKTYEPGQALSSIAVAIRRQVDVRSLVRPVLERLFQATGETVHLGKLEGTNTHFIDAIESVRAVRVASRQGMTLPANCTATGKAMLSRLTADQLRKLYPGEELPGLTKGSITSMADLQRVLEVIRKTGYATSQEESEDGVTSAAVAVLSPSGACFGINVSVPAHRMTPKARAEHGIKLQEAAKEIEGLLV